MSNTRQKPILTGIELSRKEDGYWLSFTTAKGNGACLRIETLKDRFGYITWKAIMEWAIEQTEQPEISIGAEMADCFDKMIGTTPKFLESITEHPDVQRLVGQVETLSQENKRLSQRDCNATVQILLPTADSPFNKEDCRIVDVGVSDNIYVVECAAVVELQAENKRLKEELSQLTHECIEEGML